MTGVFRPLISKALASQVRTRIVPIVHLTPHALVPAALPSKIGELQALTFLNLKGNKIAGTYLWCSTNCALTTLPAALPESIGQLQALEVLILEGNALTGEHSCSTNSPLIVVPGQRCRPRSAI